MNDKEQIRIQLTTVMDQYTVAPGDSLEIPLVLKNWGSQPDQVRISMEGIPLVWVSVEQPVVMLQAGEERTITLTVQPPEPPNSHAGRYHLWLRAASTVDPAHVAQAPIILTVAGFEAKGRVGVLLDGLQYTVIPGEQLDMPVVLINQGLGADTFGLGLENLPPEWLTIPEPSLRLEPGEVKTAILVVKPPRLPDTRPGRHTFRIHIASQAAPDQSVAIDCILTVAAFTDFKSGFVAAQPDQDLPNRVRIQNLSNMPVAFQVVFASPEDSLTFEPPRTEPTNLPIGETTDVGYTARPTRRLWVGGEREYPFAAQVHASDQMTQTLKGMWLARGLLPVWAAVLGFGTLMLLCLSLIGLLLFPQIFQGQPTPTYTETTEPIPTATISQDDQIAELIERNWYLVSFRNVRSLAGERESVVLFNPNATLVGFTGCRDFSGGYETNFNRISISNISLGSGSCPDANLQQQEDALLAILRSARSYFVANTSLQIAGDAGFLNYAITPVNRPDEIIPPVAMIRAASQSEAGQVVVFDGSGSSGQVPLVTWKWEFGDGATASGEIVQHFYRDAGSFTVRLTVSDQRGQNTSATQPIQVLAPPTAVPTPQPPTKTPAPTLAPDVPTATPEPPVVEQTPPQANLDTPRNGYVGEPVDLDASGSSEGSSPITSFAWVFGNGNGLPAGASSRATAKYDRTGDFEVTVIITDANGLTSYATSRITINARLATSVWTLSRFKDQPLLPGTAITAQFLDGSLTGFAGCNSYEGRYTATENEDGSFDVSIERVRTGRPNCPEDILDQENDFIEALEQATSVVIRENEFTLRYPEGEMVFYLVYRPGE